MRVIGQLTIIMVDGSAQSEQLSAPPSLEKLQEIVGGYIEAVPFFTTFGGAPCVAFCNEEGKLKGLPPNPAAQNCWRRALGNPDLIDDYLAGNIAVVTGDSELMAAL